MTGLNGCGDHEAADLRALPETQKRFANEGAETDSKTPAELDAFIKADIVKWARVASNAGMRQN